MYLENIDNLYSYNLCLYIHLPKPPFFQCVPLILIAQTLATDRCQNTSTCSGFYPTNFPLCGWRIFFNANLIMLKTLHWLFISSWIKTKSLNMAYKPQAGCHLPSFLTSLHVGPHISHYPSASLAFFSSLISCISTLPQDIIKISSA